MISLESAKERRAKIDAQLRPLGVEYRFFEAVDCSNGFAYFRSYDERQYLINTGRRATPGEVACFASHRCLWKQAVSMDKPILVLEDDAEIEANLSAALTETQRLIQRYGFIRLQNDFFGRNKKSVPVREAGPFTLNHYATYPFGAMGYAISPSVAAAFVDASQVLTAPVDSFIKVFWEHGRPLYGLSPYSVMGGDLSRRTTIGHRARAEMNIKMTLERRLKKAGRWIKRRRFNAAHRPAPAGSIWLTPKRTSG